MFHDMFVSVCSVLTSTGRKSESRRLPRRFNPGLGIDGLESRVVLSSMSVYGGMCSETRGLDTMTGYNLRTAPGTTITVVSSEDSGPTSQNDPATDGGDVVSGDPSGPTDTQVGSFPVSQLPGMLA